MTRNFTRPTQNKEIQVEDPSVRSSDEIQNLIQCEIWESVCGEGEWKWDAPPLNSARAFQRLLRMSSHHHTFVYMHAHVHTCTPHTRMYAQITCTCMQSTAEDTWANLTSEGGLCPLPGTCSCLSAKLLQQHTHTHTYINIHTHFLPSVPGAFK